MSLIKLGGFTIAHDPTIVKEGGLYYRFQTGPGLPICTSKDLRNWEISGRVFEKNPDWTGEKIPGSKDFWAPEVVFRNGQWRIYYSVSTFGKNTSAIGLAVTDSLTSNKGWTDLGPVIFSSPADGFNAIDPAVFTDSQGNDRLLFGSFWGGLQLVDLNREGFIAEGCKPRPIASRIPYSSVKAFNADFGKPSIEANPVEGGFVFLYQGYYYLFASHDFCCRGSASSYHIVVGRSKNPEGPFIDEDELDMLQGGGTLLRDGFSFDRWAGPGHNSIFLDEDGKSYMVYHAYDRQNDGRPNLMLEEIIWKDGWPTFD